MTIDGQGLPGSLCGPDAWNGNMLLVKRMVDLFFADELEDPQSVAEAKSICSNCPVVSECLSANLHEQHGVWGGKSENERRYLRRELRTQ
jgi:hypothetical protein